MIQITSPDYGGSKNLWNNCQFVPKYKAQYPKKTVTLIFITAYDLKIQATAWSDAASWSLPKSSAIGYDVAAPLPSQ